MQRPHPNTGRSIAEMLDEERPHLQPLPRVPYDTREVVQRLVDSTAHILYETNLYPVPEERIGELVYVCIGPAQLEVFDRGVHRLAELARIPDGAGQRQDSARRKRGRYDVTLLQERFAAWGLSAEGFNGFQRASPDPARNGPRCPGTRQMRHRPRGLGAGHRAVRERDK